MLKAYSQVFKGVVFLCDMLLIAGCWFAAYFLRAGMHGRLLDAAPNFAEHRSLAVYVVILYAAVYRLSRMYDPMRTQTISAQFIKLLRASGLALLAFIVTNYFIRKNFYYSRSTILFFTILSICAVFIFRIIIRIVLQYMRRKGFNLRHIIVVGAGRSAVELIRRIQEHLEFGLHITGYLSAEDAKDNKPILDVSHIGTYKDLKQIIRQHNIDQVVFALSAKEERFMRPMLQSLDNEAVDIKVVPDMGDFFTLRQNMEDLDGLAVLSLRQSPYEGWPRVGKRMVDIIGSLVAIIILAPLMVVIAVWVKLSSPGSIFYKQERISLDGRKFHIIKFRTMYNNAENKSGPVWAAKNDPRCTPIGIFLRKTSLDELPQFFNVLMGHMSLVGPRPERPVFVDDFRQVMPLYALRHKIKTGMTGWAQINGLRGDSSLEKRIEYDLYYIQNWSLFFDLRILLLTLPAVLKADNAS